IWLHDYESTHGTAVGQNGQNQTEVRRKETWILAYSPGSRDVFEERTIHCASLAIKIEFPNHEMAPSRYALGLDSQPATQAPSEAPTPRERLIYYNIQQIGEGTFGRVHKLIKARDGNVFAAKTFHPPSSKNKRRWQEPDPKWLIKIRREFSLMRDNPHVSTLL
ncbi:hypothetical protein M406DRAFT_251247, partial [Cryphonectria parasitica EP155]